MPGTAGVAGAAGAGGIAAALIRAAEATTERMIFLNCIFEDWGVLFKSREDEDIKLRCIKY